MSAVFPKLFQNPKNCNIFVLINFVFIIYVPYNGSFSKDNTEKKLSVPLWWPLYTKFLAQDIFHVKRPKLSEN